MTVLKIVVVLCLCAAFTSAIAADPTCDTTVAENTDHQGSDFLHVDLPSPDFTLCQQLCCNNSLCETWTYVRPGIQGPNPGCYLKNGDPAEYSTDCCTSGVKRQKPGIPTLPLSYNALVTVQDLSVSPSVAYTVRTFYDVNQLRYARYSSSEFNVVTIEVRDYTQMVKTMVIETLLANGTISAVCQKEKLTGSLFLPNALTKLTHVGPANVLGQQVVAYTGVSDFEWIGAGTYYVVPASTLPNTGVIVRAVTHSLVIDFVSLKVGADTNMFTDPLKWCS